MRYIRILLIVVVVILCVSALISTRCSTEKPSKESIEYKLACINAGKRVPRDHLTVARFKSLLQQLFHSYVEDKQQIADMSVKAQEILMEDGISENLITIMEGMNKIFYKSIENQKYANYISTYMTLRNKGFSHNEAIESLQDIVRSLGVQ